MSGSRDAWPTRLVVIGGLLLIAVFIEAVAGVVAALAMPAASWRSFSAIISPAPGSASPPPITTQKTNYSAGRTEQLGP